ncbi:uncharacterized protein LOC119082544 [Bradysia coprophila]|uniref:uncharacterized protein LOC119082544 n=1 Tax=Bradysia coprophila TaxID=38358 RepID=UPI00187DD937|nr:uncharacterized protein LOC119082544 [Bradysia coprophila]
MMDESDSNESSNVTNDDSIGCNESDNKLTQYMLINKELSKTLVVLRAENARLRNNNKELNLENLTYRNELTGNRAEIAEWRKKFTKLQAMHIKHVEVLTTELQSYANKLTGVFGSDDENVDAETTGRVTEQHSTIVNSPSNDDDRENVPPRVSRSEPSSKQPNILDENPSNLNTINEESEDDIETSYSEQISLVTSTHESNVSEVTTTNETTCGSDASKTIVARNSMSDSSEMASMNSDKENERPSSFLGTKLNITHVNSPLTTGSDSTTIRTRATESSQRSSTPLKEKFITQRRTHKRTAEENSFDDPKTPELVSSTPYKRKRSATQTEVDKRNSTPVKSNDSVRMTRRSTMSISSSGRPKRSACPVSFVEPKLNTKMRRPRT